MASGGGGGKGAAAPEPKTVTRTVGNAATEQAATVTEQAPATTEQTPATTEKAKPKPTLTVAQQNAIRAAKGYLDYDGFSRLGLIGQLKYEGYSKHDARLAVDSLHVDWNKQAVIVAKGYLDYDAFSHSGLLEQLEYDKFTPAQAAYGVRKVGL